MSIKIINQDVIDNLIISARESVRLRSHLNLHKSYDEKVQRVLIGLVKGSYVEPHFHEQNHQWEFFQIIRGELLLSLYLAPGVIAREIKLSPDSGTHAIEIPPGVIHSLECLSDDAVLLEVKEGPFDANFAKVMVTCVKHT